MNEQSKINILLISIIVMFIIISIFFRIYRFSFISFYNYDTYISAQFIGLAGIILNIFLLIFLRKVNENV